MKAKNQDLPQAKRYTDWVLKCNLCNFYKEENQTGVCPHCQCNSYYTIVVTELSASEMNGGRRISREEYEAIHFAHPRLVSIYKSKREIAPEAQALILAMCDYAGDGKDFEQALKDRQAQKKVHSVVDVSAPMRYK